MIFEYSERDVKFVKEVIDFFTAHTTNKKKLGEIKSICILDPKFKDDKNRLQDLDNGIYCIMDFSYYFFHKKMGDGINMEFLKFILKTLVDNYILASMISMNKVVSFYLELYWCHRDFVVILHKRDLIINIVLGWEHISKRYSKSVFLIEHTNRSLDKSIGTGFYTTFNDIPIIVTNNHVLEDAHQIKVFSKEQKEIEYERIVCDKHRDLGFIILKQEFNVHTLWIGSCTNILSDILMIGYPRIPLTKSSYQVHHKGEINSFVEDFNGRELFLISAKTSPGNSGSPVLDSLGQVVGVVCEQLFEKKDFEEKGIAPYNAAVPASVIVDSISVNIIGSTPDQSHSSRGL